jgi:hypothetical protein
LKDHGLATNDDDPEFGNFLLALSHHKQQAILRPGLYARRKWQPEEVASKSAPQLVELIRNAINTLLEPIGEPTFPVD